MPNYNKRVYGRLLAWADGAEFAFDSTSSLEAGLNQHMTGESGAAQ